MTEVGVEVLRVYDDPCRRLSEHRVLVDRLWPRGLAKASVAFDEWAKDVAPSTELRRWYGHQPERFDEFALRYRAELTTGPAAPALTRLREQAASGKLVLLTATRDVDRSGAAVLRDVVAGPGAR